MPTNDIDWRLDRIEKALCQTNSLLTQILEVLTKESSGSPPSVPAKFKLEIQARNLSDNSPTKEETGD